MDLTTTFQHLKKLENVKFDIDELQVKNAEKKGIQLYKQDNILRDIATFMEHPESYSFYKKYLTSPEYTQFILSLLKVYEIISGILEKHNIEFNAYHKIFVLYILTHHPTYSRIIFRKQLPGHSTMDNIKS